METKRAVVRRLNKTNRKTGPVHSTGVLKEISRASWESNCLAILLKSQNPDGNCQDISQKANGMFVGGRHCRNDHLVRPAFSQHLIPQAWRSKTSLFLSSLQRPFVANPNKFCGKVTLVYKSSEANHSNKAQQYCFQHQHVPFFHQTQASEYSLSPPVPVLPALQRRHPCTTWTRVWTLRMHGTRMAPARRPSASALQPAASATLPPNGPAHPPKATRLFASESKNLRK